MATPVLRKSLSSEADGIYVPSLDIVFPWEGTEMKTDFSFREKVFLSEIVGKKDRLSNRAEQLSNRAERLSTRAKRG